MAVKQCFISHTSWLLLQFDSIPAFLLSGIAGQTARAEILKNGWGREKMPSGSRALGGLFGAHAHCQVAEK